ncbi:MULTISPECIES: ATP synthase subunit I [Burkholderiaceae]|uniref:ATP synthase subunit I n=2 Tax=Burkholderiaceae TaxID=119060 RepID=UPI0009FB0509|nr:MULTISPECIES: ATP synthase subunit I [unclassified Burkholderia]MCF2132722.1 ATP synthase subunit I [Mycetohabitans sp. B3]MCG1017328.1 ATP synthase subunit I [Mycetohabitans sp. B4]MCG1038128.1 ATP synthase subunit I [Mycetohabitans sp. B7]
MMTTGVPENERDPAVASGSTPSPCKPSNRPATARNDRDDELEDNDIVPLTRGEAERMFGPQVSRPSRVTPTKVVAAQMVVSLAAALAWWLFSKSPGHAALSAVLGGAICWVPSALFAARLRRKGSTESILAWVLGEAVKIASTVAMFVATAMLYRNVHWLALLVTYLIALKTYWLALAWR